GRSPIILPRSFDLDSRLFPLTSLGIFFGIDSLESPGILLSDVKSSIITGNLVHESLHVLNVITLNISALILPRMIISRHTVLSLLSILNILVSYCRSIADVQL